MNLLIRDVREAEYAAVARLLVETYGGEGLVHPAYLPALEDTAARATEPHTEVIVAVESDRLRGDDAGEARGNAMPAGQSPPAVVGTATLALPGARLNSAGQDPAEATLRMLAVHPKARCQGVATALVLECVARARLAGATALGLDTTDAMTAAHRLYERHGFMRQPDRDAEARSGGMLRAYHRALAPAAQVRLAQPNEYELAGSLTLDAYLAAGLLDAADDYAAHLLDAEQRAREAELLIAHTPDGTLLGTVTYCPTGSMYVEIARPDEGEFRMLAVAPNAQRRGVGEALVRACMRRARATGKRGVALSTATKMLTAHRMYERLGFGRDAARDWEPIAGIKLLAYCREV